MREGALRSIDTPLGLYIEGALRPDRPANACSASRFKKRGESRCVAGQADFCRPTARDRLGGHKATHRGRAPLDITPCNGYYGLTNGEKARDSRREGGSCLSDCRLVGTNLLTGGPGQSFVDLESVAIFSGEPQPLPGPWPRKDHGSL